MPIPLTTASARRKLIRGAFSVPAVLAVHNGSALAASSNQMRCAVNAVGSGDALPVSVSAGPDNWVRVQRYRRTNNVLFVSMADINAVGATLGIPVSIPGANASTTFIRWSDGALRTFASSQVTADGSNLVALRFAGVGAPATSVQIVGIVTQAQSSGTAPTGTNAITQSCWTSMMP